MSVSYRNKHLCWKAQKESTLKGVFPFPALLFLPVWRLFNLDTFFCIHFCSFSEKTPLRFFHLFFHYFSLPHLEIKRECDAYFCSNTRFGTWEMTFRAALFVIDICVRIVWVEKIGARSPAAASVYLRPQQPRCSVTGDQSPVARKDPEHQCRSRWNVAGFWRSDGATAVRQLTRKDSLLRKNIVLNSRPLSTSHLMA